MAKGWTTIRTNATKNYKTPSKKATKVIKNTASLSVEKLKEQGKELYAQKIAAEDKLITAVDEKRAIKKEQIEAVAAIKASREEQKKKASAKKTDNEKS